jgi:hypothetical protein
MAGENYVDAPAALDVQRRAINDEYGDPYDPNAVSWARYGDPKRVGLEAQAKEEAAHNRKQNAVEGKTYVFRGHVEWPYENTERINSSEGVIERNGDPVKLSDELVADLRDRGFQFEEVAPADEKKAKEKANPGKEVS